MVKKGHKQCPVCFEAIREEALACRFCGAILTDRPLPKFLPRDQAVALEDARERAGTVSRPTVPEAGEAPEGLRDLQKHLEHEDIDALVERRFAGTPVPHSARQRQRLEEFLESSEDEYRTASVLFVDVTGYVSLSQKLKAEYLKDLLDAFYEICTQAVDRHNGFIVKFEGDACLAVFGAPVAYDRDVEASVRAALEIRDQVRVFPLIEGERVRTSAGIDTGEILSSFVTREGRRDFDIFGDTVNMAARIESAAAPDTIRVSPSTYEQLKGIFDFRRKRPRRFKNVPDLLATYEVIGQKEDGGQRRDFSLPFVGREEETARLTRLWGEFLEGDKIAGGVRIIGSPGIGKTRLVKEFLGGRKATVLKSEGSPQSARIPFGAWRQAIGSLWGGSADEAPEKIEEEIEALKSLHGLDSPMMGLKAMFGLSAALEEARGLRPADLKREMTADLRSLLSALSAKGSLALFFDDLQWGDASSLETLGSLIAPPQIGGAFWIFSHRIEFRPPRNEIRTLPVIKLRVLPDVERDRLLQSLLPVEIVSPEVIEALSTQAAGNPLFLIEMLRNVMDKLAKEAEGLRGRDLARRIREWVPGTLRGILQARIDLLSRRRRLVLQCGSVLGHRFAYSLIELFDLIRQGLMARLYALKGMEFLDEVRSAAELEFYFRHHLMRETAYRSLLERQRREFHRVVAERIEKTFRSRLADVYPVLAYHFDKGNIAEKAIHYLQLAGDRAMDQAALAEAIDFYQSALDRLLDGHEGPAEETQAAAILRAMGRSHRFLGENETALACFEKGGRLPTISSKKHLQAEMKAEIGITLLQMARWSESRSCLQEARKLRRNLDDPALRAMIVNGLGYAAWGIGDHPEARRHYSVALQISLPPHALGIHADARNNLALIEWRAGRLDKSLDHFRESLRLWRRLGNRFGVAATLMNVGIIEENRGRYAHARRAYAKALDLAEKIHFAQAQTACLSNLGNLALCQGRAVEAMEHNARSLEVARSIQDRRSEAIALENLALGDLMLHRQDEAGKTLAEARALARGLGDRERSLSLDLVEIEMLLDRRSNRFPRKKLRNLIARSRAVLRENGYVAEKPRLLRLELRAALAGGESGTIRDLYEKALAECRRQGNRVEERRVRAIVKSAEG